MIALDASTGDLVLVAAVFLACAVEKVEALTIVVAVGQTRSWRSAVEGVAVAVVVLAVIVLAFGPALLRIPLDPLRVVVGGVLLVFGLQWLRKAVLRSSGLKAKHDEDAIYAETVAELEEEAILPGRDRLAFVVAFKGVFLEGLEVVVAVLTLGVSAHRLPLAAATAAVALLVVGVIGAIVARQLSGVPENAMKMSVGVMLVSYGTFWTGEGLKVRWPGADLMLLVLVGVYAAGCWLLIAALRARTGTTLAEAAA